MALVQHPVGNYQFVTFSNDPRILGSAPFSNGVVAPPGYAIVHATFQEPLPYRAGFAAAEAYGNLAGHEGIAGTADQTIWAFTLMKVVGRDVWIGEPFVVNAHRKIVHTPNLLLRVGFVKYLIPIDYAKTASSSRSAC